MSSTSRGAVDLYRLEDLPFMGDHNSLAVYTAVWRQLCLDIADSYPSNDVAGDLKKAASRFASEGIAFFSKRMPALAKELDQLLAQQIDVFTAIGFRKRAGGHIPKFFGWLFEHVMSDDGRLRSDASPTAVLHLRQILYYLYKLELPYDEATSKKVIDSFVQIEKEISDGTARFFEHYRARAFDRIPTVPLHPPLNRLVHGPYSSEEGLTILTCVINYARQVINRVASGCDFRNIIPGHGPGAVSTGETPAEKSNLRRIYPALERVYPFTEYMRYSLTHVSEDMGSVVLYGEATAKVVLVPKDSRGPRLISCEPLEIQWIQQGIKDNLVTCIESAYPSRGRVNFADQTINQKLALAGSVDGSVDTLDMKDASDRVSLELVECLFQDVPLLAGLLASRSTATRLPDGTVLALKKFAPMGSALCFPVEALVFYALSVGVIRTFTGCSLRHAGRAVTVFGDDIIVGSKYSGLLTQFLPWFGLMFNQGKCCTSGFFRESCGVDAYKGILVTPLRLKKLWSHQSRSTTSLVSYVAHANGLQRAGYWRAASMVRELVESVYGPLPVCEEHPVDYIAREKAIFGLPPSDPRPAVIGWELPHVNPVEYNRKRFKVRFNPNLFRYEVYSIVIRPVYEDALGNGWKEMLRGLRGSQGSKRRRYAIPRRSCQTRKWGTFLLGR